MHGISGLVMDPMKGAQDAGAKGFLKVSHACVYHCLIIVDAPTRIQPHSIIFDVTQGMGKGLVGVVVKPVGGVIDFTSQTFGALRTMADSVCNHITSNYVLLSHFST